MTTDQLNHLSRKVIGAAIEVHKELGPGLLESVYQECLFMELRKRRFYFKAQYRAPIFYKGIETKKDFYLDFLIEDHLVLEIKAVENVLPVHKAQTLTYLKLSDKKLALLINFNVAILKQGITRIVYQLEE